VGRAHRFLLRCKRPWPSRTRRRRRRCCRDQELLRPGALDGGEEALGGFLRHLELGLPVKDANGADIAANQVASAADQRQQPFRVGVLLAADIDAKPRGGTAGAGFRLALRTGGGLA